MTASSANLQSIEKSEAELNAFLSGGYTSRKNPLADMDFNIIADTIRCQNLKKQMNLRLMSLKRNLSRGSQQNLYS